MTDDRYERVTFRGHTVDRYTMAALLEMERRLGYELTILQGSYNAGGTDASKGTHDGGGAVDLAPFEADRKVKVAREVGFAAWHRLPSQGQWVEHVHMILVGDQKMSAAAADQVTDYRNGRNGLANHLPDATPRPNPIPVFNYQGTPPPKSNAARVDGADISHFQGGVLDFKAAKAAGLLFVYHKCTEGVSMTDDRYKARRVEVNAAGLRWGAYCFARPKSSTGAVQATRFLAAAALKPGDMVPMLDLEDDGDLTKTQLTRWVGDFVKVVKDKTGQLPIIYTPFGLDETFGCRLWVARYNDDMRAPNVPEPWDKQRPLIRKKWTLWQFSNGALGVPDSVAGLGHVDLDTLGGTKATRKLRLRRLVLKKPVAPDPTPAPVSDPTPVPDPTPPPAGPSPLGVISWNVGDGHDSTKVTDLIELSTHGHLIGLQEASDRADAVSTFTTAHPMWDSFAGSSTGAPAVPSLYRVDQFKLISAQAVLCVPARNVGKEGAGPTVSKPKYATVLHLEHLRTGLHVQHINTHMIPSAADTKLPADERKKRTKHYTDHVAALVKIIDGIPADQLVILTGDFNASPSFRLLKPLHDLGMVGWQTVGTHGRSKYDNVLTRGAVVSRKVATYQTSSDHLAAGAVLKVTG